MTVCLHKDEEGHTDPPGSLSSWIQVERRTMNPQDFFCLGPLLLRFWA